MEDKESKELLKRGSKVETGREGTIYALEFLKDSIMLCSKYYFDWCYFLEDDTYRTAIIDRLLEIAEDEEEREKSELLKKVEQFKNIELKKGYLKNIFDKFLMEINYAISLLENNCSITEFNFSLENIESCLEKLKIITDYFYERCSVDYVNFYCNFYDHIVTFPIYQSFELISESVQALRNVDKEWLEMAV